MKTPHQCHNMLEIRAEIDLIDQEVIRLLGRRFEYVKAATHFKTSENTVKAPERFKTMLAQRRKWAEEEV
jgi:isochorismate pyruvate lyase